MLLMQTKCTKEKDNYLFFIFGGLMSKVIVFCFLSLAFLNGCATKKPAANPVASGDFSEPMAFDQQGSDSKKINGLNSVHFKFDSSVLTKENEDVLAENAKWVNEHKTVNIQIEGHCDIKGSDEYNLALGERRAKSVRDYLVALGVRADRLTTISYGKEKPLSTDDNDEAQAQNRRANFVPISAK